MEAKLKAKSLVDNYFNIIIKTQQYLKNKQARLQAKQCALICVDEILNTYDKNSEELIANNGGEINYWLSVKSEIEKL